jgi:hypothetical protein
MLLRVAPGGPGVRATFTVTLPNGTMRGMGSARIRLGQTVVHFNGDCDVIGGTGAYADAHGSDLRYTGSGASNGSTSTVHLTGKLWY